VPKGEAAAAARALERLSGVHYSAEEWSLLASYIRAETPFQERRRARRYLLQYTESA
jgi:hypothetical protein